MTSRDRENRMAQTSIIAEVRVRGPVDSENRRLSALLLIERMSSKLSMWQEKSEK